ncbi:hypothetical protein DAPPUDRAFT_95326 [Daphnia pulex]|uniref:Transmembrane protein n=1 Tax=Daphnia pulex TaxID=6669 RepID=E9FVC7_DAPPU|nr:hypothetical protein DAPPUDRAFT_95326 [Daphnia pulex]|eukprot:EFX89131.1 hypothetical protein DAPPUDRAFT_95326 [Daphnia pulex]
MDDQGGTIQIVVTPNCPATESLLDGGQENADPNQESSPCLLDPTATAAGSTDCSRSVISHGSSNISYQQRQRRAQWKGIGTTCMWNAFRASFFGLLLLVSGCIVVLVGGCGCVSASPLFGYFGRFHFIFFAQRSGFYSEFPSIEIAVNFNQTVSLVDPESQKRRVKSSYSYIGPVLIGIGVFVLIGVGVATMEMRDMTAKVFPLTKRPYKKTKLTSEALGTMFQTPTQRIMKEMSAKDKRPERQTSFRTVATQTFRTRLWPWSRLRPSSGRFVFHGRIVLRSCHQLSTPKSQQSVILPQTSICKRGRRSRCRRRRMLLIHSMAADSLSASCPQLDTVS